MKRALFAITFLAAAACTTGALAQQTTTKDGKRIGTRDELRACYDSRDALASQHEELMARRKKLAADADALNTEGEELRDQLKHAADDNLTGPRRDRLDRKIKEHDAHAKEMKDRAAAMDNEVAAYEKQEAAQQAKCNDVAYQAEDVTAVKKEREAAGKKD